jgi:polar amino acid transport system substrate-binding protein
MTWPELIKALKSGEIDFAMGAYRDRSRTNYAYYSNTYRTEQNAVYYRKNIDQLGEIKKLGELITFFGATPLKMAVINEYAYGSEKIKNLLKSPPSGFEKIPSENHQHSLRLALQGRVDIFMANPIIMDNLLAKGGFSRKIGKLNVDIPEIPVHVMLSRQTMTSGQVEEINSAIKSLQAGNRIRSLHIKFMLPAYLSITTGQLWFSFLTMLGISAFCISGILLARKERYNFFGAMVLAILPAIGGGTLRDIFLGADKIFVLETPAFMLMAVALVTIGFIGFKAYDRLRDSSVEIAGKIRRFSEKNLSGTFDSLFKFFDAWAVATFTVIGVGVAIETQASPVLLWGPAMGVLTASGGVVLRDVVRADFNIEILKQDSYAEISILGGLIYTGALMLLPYEKGLDTIFYLTVSVIGLLFRFRFWILWKGYPNPLQFGAMHTHPDIRLDQFENLEPELWKMLAGYYTQNEDGSAAAAADTELESLHNRFLYTSTELRQSLDLVAAEPLTEATISKYRQCSSRLEIAASVEKNLYSFLANQPESEQKLSDTAADLQQRINESLKALIESAGWAIESDDAMDLDMLEKMTSSHQERFNQVRARYMDAGDENRDFNLKTVLQSTHKVERIIYLLGDYVRLRLNKKETRAGSASNRKAQQKHLLS